MRASMSKKPLDYPREYFEVHCTTAQKKYFEYMAFATKHKSPGAFVAERMTRDAMPANSGKTQKEWIKHWEEKLATEKASREKVELHNREKSETDRATSAAAQRVMKKYQKIKSKKKATR